LKQILIISFLILCEFISAQDKLFYKNGTTRTGIFLSLSKENVFFKVNDTSALETIKKTELLLIETYSGKCYVIGSKNKVETSAAPTNQPIIKNSLLITPVGFLVGRFTLMFEHLNPTGKIGFAFPLTLTFDPYPVTVDSTINSIKRNIGVNFMSGIDINFYLSQKETSRFFIGPRLRFGTNLFIAKFEYATLQTQVGWKFTRPQGRFAQQLSFGFGLLKPTTVSARTNNDRFYAWYSVNYLIGLKW
jgi:hypothetical protein